MLEKIRNRKVYLYSTVVIVFALLAKMLVPIAHASNNASNGQKSFLASLCAGNKIIFVDLSLPTKDEHQPKIIIANSKCPLCNINEQVAGNDNVVVLDTHSKEKAQRVINTDDAIFSAYLSTPRAIRAPPF